MNIANQTVGSFAMLAYALITAFSAILIHHTNQTIPPLLSAFYTFSFCILVYLSVSTSLFAKISTIKKYSRTILMLNITTAICWILSFFSLKFIAPELYLFTYLCAMPIASSLIYKKYLIKSGLFFIGMIVLALTYQEKLLVLGVTLAFIGGASGTVYSIYSKQITAHFSTFEILALRFYLTVFLAFVMIIYADGFQLMSFDFYAQFAIMSLLSVVIPLTLFQVGIKNLHLTTALSYLPLAPLSCYILRLFMVNTPINMTQMAVVVFLGAAMFFIKM